MNYIKNITIAILTILAVCSASIASSADLGSELQLKKEDAGPTYEETVAFLQRYPTFEDKEKGYFNKNLRIENCILKFDWRGDNKVTEGFFSDTVEPGKGGTGVLNLKDTVALFSTDQSSNQYHITFKHKDGDVGWYIYFKDSYTRDRYFKAFAHLRKLCGAKDEAF